MPASGAVDAIVGRFVVGWAHDPDDADRRLELEVELDGQVVARGSADIERTDLVTAGIGDGHHAFRIELPQELEAGSEHVLVVRTQGAGEVVPLANDFSVRLDGDPDAPAVLVRSAPRARLTTADAGAELTDAASPRAAPAPALLGRDGWLFELRDLDRLGRLLGTRVLSPSQVEFHRGRLLLNRDRLAELGIPYVLAAVPDRASIYAEQLPDELRPEAGSRAVELIAASLRDHNGIELIDLLPDLRDARVHGPLAPRTAIGLTWLGAFHTYRGLAKELAKRFPALEPRAAGSLQFGSEAQVQASLVGRERMALVGSALVEVVVGPEEPETEPELAGAGLKASFAPLSPALEEGLGRGASMLECPEPDVPATALVVHQGRAGRVAGLLAEHFALTLIGVSTELPYEMIVRESPAVVVQLVDEWRFCG